MLEDIPMGILPLWAILTALAVLLIAIRRHTYKGRQNPNDDMMTWVLLYLLCSAVLFVIGGPLAAVFRGKIGG